MGVCMVVLIGNVIVVADIGPYLVSIFVTIVCIIILLLHHCIGALMMFYNPSSICSISFSWYIFFNFKMSGTVCMLFVRCFVVIVDAATDDVVIIIAECVCDSSY